MRRTLKQPTIPPIEPTREPVFSVVIAYEDFDTGKHAKVTYDFLARTVGNDCRFTNEMWKFDILGMPKLREMALTDARKADIIIVSGHGREELPRHVKEWLESGLTEGTHAIALVALFDCPKEEAARTRVARNYLARVAENAGVEFFAQPDDSPRDRVMDDFPEMDVQPDRRKTFSTLSGLVQRDVTAPRWGLNE